MISENYNDQDEITTSASSREKLAQTLASDVETWLKNGNKITVVPPGTTAALPINARKMAMTIKREKAVKALKRSTRTRSRRKAA